jgi:hypothetical protein
MNNNQKKSTYNIQVDKPILTYDTYIFQLINNNLNNICNTK